MFLDGLEHWDGFCAYSIASSEFLFRSDHGAGSLGGVEGASALDHGLSLSSATAVLAPNPSNRVPVTVSHFEKDRFRCRYDKVKTGTCGGE